MRFYTGKTTYEAAKDRLRFIFDEFDDVVVSISGGKDSTVILEIALEIAREKNRLPLKCMFIDQEAEWTETINYIERIAKRPELSLDWLQMPILLTNSTSFTEHYLECWKPGDEWIRPKAEGAITENVYGTNRFHSLFEAYMKVHYHGKKACMLAGVRTEESPGRLLGLTQRATYKWMTFGKRLSDLHFSFYPLYDWGVTDVWKYIFDNDLRYNKIYDYQYQHGVKIGDMRVSNLHHETAVKNLFYLPEVDIALYNKLTKRIQGIDMANKMQEDFFIRELPFMFNSWKEYGIYLLDNLTQRDDIRQKLKKDIEYLSKKYDGFIKESDTISMYRSIIWAICANDIDGTKLRNLDITLKHKKRDYAKFGDAKNSIRGSKG